MRKKLSQLTIARKAMEEVTAGIIIRYWGKTCECGCYYADSGGSATLDNGIANCDDNLSSAPRPA